MNSTCKTLHGDQYDKICPDMPDRCFKIADSDDEINKDFDCDDRTLVEIPKGSEHLQKWIKVISMVNQL